MKKINELLTIPIDGAKIALFAILQIKLQDMQVKHALMRF
jgi:hypothetical protein